MATEPVLPPAELTGRPTAGSPAPTSRPRSPPPTCRAARPWPTRWPPRSPSTPGAGPRRTSSATTSRRWAGPTVELPLLTGPMDVGCLFELAGRLEDHLRAEVAA